MGAQENPKGEGTCREESQKEQKNIQGRNEEKVGLKETGFSSGRESQVPRIEGGGHHQTDKGGKPALGFGTNEVIGHWASNDVQQIPGSEEGKGSGRVGRKHGVFMHVAGGEGEMAIDKA